MNAERLRELYECDFECGLLISRRTRKPVGSKTADGYLNVKVDGVALYVHRVLFFLAYGYLPKLIDHINCNKLDNRIANLREATPQQNQLNRRSARGYYRRGDRFIAQVGHRYLGIFDSEAEAIAARKSALGQAT